MKIEWKRNLRILTFALVVSACVATPLGWLLTRNENARFSGNEKAGVIDYLSMVRANLEVTLNSPPASYPQFIGLRFHSPRHQPGRF